MHMHAHVCYTCMYMYMYIHCILYYSPVRVAIILFVVVPLHIRRVDGNPIPQLPLTFNGEVI